MSNYVVVTPDAYDSFIRSEGINHFVVGFYCEAAEQVVVTDLEREQVCDIEETSLYLFCDVRSDSIEVADATSIYIRSARGHALAVFHRRLLSALQK
jgi:hypothetical protein